MGMTKDYDFLTIFSIVDNFSPNFEIYSFFKRRIIAGQTKRHGPDRIDRQRDHSTELSLVLLSHERLASRRVECLLEVRE